LPDPTNAVCLGHVLYGLSPVSNDVASPNWFRPAVRRMTSNLIHVAQHKVEESRGFLSDYHLGHAIFTGVIPLGIGDGMRRPVNGGTTYAVVKGQRVPIIGTSLEHTVLDLTGVESAQVGDEVVLVGKMGNSVIALEDWARWFGCSPLEVIINFGGRVTPKYVNQADAVWASFGA
jgi:alanine racemase